MLEDFVQFIEMGLWTHQPENWISPLIKLSLLSTEKDFYDEYDKLDSEIADMLMNNYPRAEIAKKFLQYRSEYHNNILCLKNITVGNRTELILAVHYLVREVVVESAQENDRLDLLHYGMMNVVMFHRIYLNTYFQLLKDDVKLQEDIVESTQVSRYNVFTLMDMDNIDEYPAFNLKYTDKVSLSALFKHYQISYYVILEESEFLNATKSAAYFLGVSKDAPEDSDDVHIGPNFAIWLEDFIMKILTFCKIFKDFYFGIDFQKVSDKISETANRLSLPYFDWLPYKTDLWMADKLYNDLQSNQQYQVQDTSRQLEIVIDSLDFRISNIKQDADNELR